MSPKPVYNHEKPLQKRLLQIVALKTYSFYWRKVISCEPSTTNLRFLKVSVAKNDAR